MKKLKNLETKCLVQLRKMKLNQYSQQDQERIVKRIEYEEKENKKFLDNWMSSVIWKAALLNLFRKGFLKPRITQVFEESLDIAEKYSEIGTTSDRADE